MLTTKASFAIVLLTAVGTPTRPVEQYAGKYTVTAYCSCRKCCGKHADGITASGKRVNQGMVAADWDVLPKGARVRLSCFPGRTFVVEDVGGAIKGRRIDVWYPSHRAARKFGIRREIKVWILDPNPPAADNVRSAHKPPLPQEPGKS